MADNGVRRVVRVGTTMLSIGGVEFPRSVCVWGGGGAGWPLHGGQRIYSSRLTVVSRGLIGGADTLGKGEWGVGSSFPY